MNVRLLLNAVVLCVLPAFSQYMYNVVSGPSGIASMQAIGDSLYLSCSHVEGQGSLMVVKNGVHKIVQAGNSNFSNPVEFTVFNNTVYYCVNDGSSKIPGSCVNALWKTDGISVVTEAVNGMVGEPVVIGDFMYFRKYDFLSGHELWKFDGVNTSMVADMVPGMGSFYPTHITVFNKRLYFMANHPAYGFELWTSDGTKAGTYLLKDIWQGNNGSGSECNSVYKFTEYNNRFYFLANDGIHGVELWHSDGTPAGTTLLKDILPGEASAFRNGISPLFCVFNNELYFVPDASANGKELWKTNGTASGTVMLKDINPGPDGSDITELQVSNGYLYFNADDGVHGKELWRTDGTPEGTVMVLDLQPQISGEKGSYPKDLTSHTDGKLYFICKKSLENSYCEEVEDCSLRVTISLYRTDGTVGGTEKILDFPAGEELDANHMITATNHGLYFRSIIGNNSCLLWLNNDTHLDFTNPPSAPASQASAAQVTNTVNNGSLKVYSYEEQNHNYCQSNPRIRVVNTGSAPVSDFKVEYYFMVENGKTPILDRYYTGDCSVYLVQIDGPNYKIVYDYTGKTIQPGQSLPDLAGTVVGLHYPDYSPFDKTNDYSNNLSYTFSENNHICVYSQSNTLIYGVSPFSSSPTPNQPPVIIVTDSIYVVDAWADGEYVFLDASQCYDPDGNIVSYEWYNGSTLLGTSMSGYITLYEGVHKIILKVTDDDGATTVDTITVNVELNVDRVSFYITAWIIVTWNPVVIEYIVPEKYDGAVIRYTLQRAYGLYTGTLDGSKGYHRASFDWSKNFVGGYGPWPITFEVNGVVTDTIYIRYTHNWE